MFIVLLCHGFSPPTSGVNCGCCHLVTNAWASKQNSERMEESGVCFILLTRWSEMKLKRHKRNLKKSFLKPSCCNHMPWCLTLGVHRSSIFFFLTTVKTGHTESVNMRFKWDLELFTARIYPTPLAKVTQGPSVML